MKVINIKFFIKYKSKSSYSIYSINLTPGLIKELFFIFIIFENLIKIHKFQNILKEYTHIQLIFHAKALEMLTIAYKELLDINTQNDLEVFLTNYNVKIIQINIIKLIF